MTRTLIVNADDFGLSDGVNDGIIDAHQHGIVTSTTLMVRQPAAAAAASLAAANPSLCVGLHVDLGEWIYEDETWTPAYVVVDLEDPRAVRLELDDQLRQFELLVGRPPTHLDSHQHVHRANPVADAVIAVGARLAVPVRDRDVRYIGGFYGQTGTGAPLPEAITVDALVALITDLPEGVSELGCHPGYVADVNTTYASEREVEVRTLCDPAVRRALHDANVELRSFCEIAR